MTRFRICVRVQLWKSSEYSRIRICQTSAYVSVTQVSGYGSIMPEQAVLNMPGIVIQQGCENARVTKGFEYP